jgi:hypothetical protein
MAVAVHAAHPIDFYAVTATIIPVLYIAVLLEARIFELGPIEERPTGFALATVLTCVAVAGEAAALKTLWTGDTASENAEGFIVTALLMLGVALVTLPLMQIVAPEMVIRTRVQGFALSVAIFAIFATGYLVVRLL